MSELALKLITENKKTRSPFLDLGNCGLTEVPEEIGELVWLEELSFASEFKNAPLNSDGIGDEIISLLNFKKKLAYLDHFYTSYDHIEYLKRQFNDQLEKLREKGI